MFRIAFMIGVLGIGTLFPTLSLAQSRLDSQILEQVDQGAVNAQLKPDFDDQPVDPRSIIAGAIQVILSLIGTIFLIMIVSGGYVYFTAGGDEGRVAKARSTITNGVIGLVIILAAYSITLFVVRGIRGSIDDGQVDRNDIRQNSDILNDRLNEGDFFR